MPILVKRVYEAPAASDGLRILVDRLWPRGLTKEKAQIAQWMKAVSPSSELRQWYGHDPAKWLEFQQRYARELAQETEAVEALKTMTRQEVVTLVYSSQERELNNAVALKAYLEALK